MSRKRVDLLLENITIEACAAEGKALTHWNGVVVFVPFAVPGDVVDIRVTKKSKNYYEGFVEKIGMNFMIDEDKTIVLDWAK